MPYTTEHAARQTDPGGYSKFRRKTLSPGVDAIIGIKDDGGSDVQSVRLDAEKFTADAAKKWLKDHGFKASLEAAVEKSAALVILTKAYEKRYTLGVVYEPDTLDTDHEFAKAEDIEDAAWAFMARLQDMAKSGARITRAALRREPVEIDDTLLEKSGLDDEHLQVGDDEYLGTIVESYLAPTDLTINGQTVKKGAWLLGVRWSPEMFKKIKRGERTGFSMYGRTDKIREVA